MKTTACRQRWAVSFADLCLLLLGFFVLLQARPDPDHLSAGLRAAFGARAPAELEHPAKSMFEPGEAILTAPARADLAVFARSAQGGGLIVASHGSEGDAARFDGWELAAARTAAVARALSAGGIPQEKIALAIDPATGGGQVIRISRD